MNIGSICQHEIVTTGADASLREPAAMRERHVAGLVVTDAGARPPAGPIGGGEVFLPPRMPGMH